MRAKILRAPQTSLLSLTLCICTICPIAGFAEAAEVPSPIEDEAVTGASAQAALETAADEDAALLEEVVVTGSRIKRDEFSSISPVQIIQGQRSRDLGLINTAGLLQGSTAASGVQIDNTFNAFVLDNGPGASNINLRGLDPTRTLLLVNSRRMAPSGVGGAPTAPDLNSIPSIMIQRVEVLTDGASSIYGSDAVAGVVNVLMRQQFDGFEFEADYVHPEASAAEEAILSAAWGRDFDRGSFGVGAEYYNQSSMSYRHRGHTTECNRYLQIDERGVIRSDDLSLAPGTTINGCKLNTINRVFLRAGPFGNIWYTPGATNIGIPNFSETTVSPGLAGFNPTINPVDVDGDGEADFGLIDPDGNGRTEVDLKSSLYNYNGTARDRSGDYISELERFNLYSLGSYELQDANNTSVFYELLYNRRKSSIFSPGASIFPDVPASNPYNPCNQQAPGGVNCWGFFVHPVFGPFNFGGIEAVPIIMVRGDRDQVDVEQDQVRALAGVEGDLPWGTTWGWEAFASFTWSNGKSSRDGILDRELTLSQETAVLDPNTGNIVCGADSNGDGIPDGQGCVPVNLFADSLYQPGGGDFATQAERDYLFGTRKFDTVFKQTVLSAVVQGDIGRLPWNNIEIPLVVGLEYRKDVVDSQPNDIARDGLLFGFFSDRGAKGSRNLKEAYLETEFRFLEGKPLADELLLNLSGRWTDESTYGSNYTYSVKLRYSPVEAWDIRIGHGTSFRAPNAREQFLLGQSGFLTLADPCIVPVEARVPTVDPNAPPGYDDSLDDRSEQLLQNCRAQGVDPTSLGLQNNSQASYSVEIFDAGGETVQSTIDPETSKAVTAGMVFRQPWFDSFDLNVSGTYWRIEVEDSIAQLNPAFFVQDCYVDRGAASSAYCRFITRDSDGFLEFIDSSYFNVHEEVAAGWDWNLLFETEVIVNDKNLGLSVDARATRTNQQLFVLGDTREDSAGRPFAPEWTGNLTLEAEYDDFKFSWRSTYTGGGKEEPEDFDSNDTCTGLGVGCRPLYFTKSSWVHTASLTWSPNDWRVTFGVRNLFDEKPQLLDNDTPGTQVNNLPLGVYSLSHHVGRSFFAGVSRTLGLLRGRARGY